MGKPPCHTTTTKCLWGCAKRWEGRDREKERAGCAWAVTCREGSSGGGYIAGRAKKLPFSALFPPDLFSPFTK